MPLKKILNTSDKISKKENKNLESFHFYIYSNLEKVSNDIDLSHY